MPRGRCTPGLLSRAKFGGEHRDALVCVIMRVIHLLEELGPGGGGIPPAVIGLAESQSQLGASVSLYGLQDPYAKHTEASSGIRMAAFWSSALGGFGFAPRLLSSVRRLEVRADIVHLHGIWKYPAYAARILATELGARLFIAPHGMLLPVALSRSVWKKRIAQALYVNRLLESADAYHALSELEAESIRRETSAKRIFVVPNGCWTGQLHGERQPLSKSQGGNENRTFLYLGRIHPIKGVDLLLRGWIESEVWKTGDRLLLVGPNDSGTIESIRRELGVDLADFEVQVVGPRYGAAKWETFRSSDVFVLTSRSEAFSMSVVEALSCGLPVLVSEASTIPGLRDSGAAIVVPENVCEVAAGLRRLARISSAQLTSMGRLGHALVESEYDWTKLGAHMLHAYAEVIAGTV